MEVRKWKQGKLGNVRRLMRERAVWEVREGEQRGISEVRGKCKV